MKQKPNDLGVKIGSKEEVLWTAVLRNAKTVREQAEETITIQVEIIKIAKRKITEEKEKFK